jgi:hypothetical protein
VTTARFDRKIVQRGDLLVLSRNPSVRLMFKFMSGSNVVATWLDKRPGMPNDAILLQRQVLRLVG